MIQAMTDAGEIARQQSQGFRDIEIAVTELGFAIRGSDVVNDHKVTASGEVEWHVFQNAPAMLPNAVRLVAGSLDAKK